jgi:hypothetical protein|tara:strand:- start:553 stop:726 length:174 start_codon:yes stop_codon:yes gene_type:complete
MQNKKQERKQYLDKRTKDGLLSECDRMANYYEKYKLEKQAKKLREFKKQVKNMVGSL